MYGATTAIGAWYFHPGASLMWRRFATKTSRNQRKNTQAFSENIRSEVDVWFFVVELTSIEQKQRFIGEWGGVEMVSNQNPWTYSIKSNAQYIDGATQPCRVEGLGAFWYTVYEQDERSSTRCFVSQTRLHISYVLFLMFTLLLGSFSTLCYASIQ